MSWEGKGGGGLGGCGENIGGCGEKVENSGEKCKFAGEKKMYHRDRRDRGGGFSSCNVAAAAAATAEPRPARMIRWWGRAFVCL